MIEVDWEAFSNTDLGSASLKSIHQMTLGEARQEAERVAARAREYRELLEATQKAINAPYDDCCEFELRMKRIGELVSKELADPVSEQTCLWHFDRSHEYWTAKCGLDWCFNDDGMPSEHEMKYCPKCGRIILSTPL